MLHVNQASRSAALMDRINQNPGNALTRYFTRNKMEISVAISVIAALGIAYLECHRRGEDRMNNLVMKCSYLKCKPDDLGNFPSFVNDGYPCKCPPPEIASRMHFPNDFLESFGFDYLKDMRRVCHEDFGSIPVNNTNEKVIEFCKNIDISYDARENAKGFYRKFLETIYVI